MRVRNYPGRAVLEDPELVLDPDATRGRAMEYEASWQECGVNWTNVPRKSDDCLNWTSVTESEPTTKEEADNDSSCDARSRCGSVADDDCRSSTSRHNGSERSSSAATTDSDGSEICPPSNSGSCSGFLIPRPRLIVPVHTYARRRRTGALQFARKRPIREGIYFFFAISSLSVWVQMRLSSSQVCYTCVRSCVN